MFKAFDERRFYPTTEASLQFQADTPSEQNEWLLAIQNEVINCRISEVFILLILLLIIPESTY